MTNFNIKIISDTVCPWCYVGKRRLERAIDIWRKTYPGGAEDTFTIRWAPFYLDPSAPAAGEPARARYAAKFGAARAAAMLERMEQIGRAEGIAFAFAGRTGNTRDSHRLIALAGRRRSAAAQSAVVQELFASYFEGEGDITAHATLVAAAERAGLDPAEVRGWLASDEGGAEVDREVDEAYAMNVHGVPHFTIQGTHTLEGGQEPEAFLAKFKKVKEAEK
ncbi:DSBA-like thioredoxin domain-containing protein [Xylariomycetidae sp. FL0641]|nr:DSBA-like thioredoxin domain-containing protein [Xylariomycetidae sp. FL0641]